MRWVDRGLIEIPREISRGLVSKERWSRWSGRAVKIDKADSNERLYMSSNGVIAEDMTNVGVEVYRCGRGR